MVMFSDNRRCSIDAAYGSMLRHGPMEELMVNPSIADLRKEYTLQALDEAKVDPDPFRQFQRWFDQALEAQLPEPNAMTLATATPDGKPAARIVLLKYFDTQGFVFFSNYASRKGQELMTNPWAALVFWWAELERQVRIEGSVAQVAVEESDAYYSSRPLGSQIGAWVSQQSQVIADRQVLEQRYQELQAHSEGQALLRPPYWGGYRLSPTEFEFWQGRPSRLHDRLRYLKLGDRTWKIERLSP